MMLNPIIRKEMKMSLRSSKMFFSISSFTFLSSIFSIIFINILIKNSFYGISLQEISMLYFVIGSSQFGFTIVLIPALTGGAISGEREKQTLDMLILTKMSSLSIICGKLFSSISIFLLIMVATLPVFSIVLFFCNLSIINILSMELFIVILSAMVGSISIFYSTMFKKTVSSIVLTFVTLGAIFSLPLIISVIYSNYYYMMNSTYPDFVGLFGINLTNPVIGFASLIDNQMGLGLVGEFLYLDDSPTVKFLANNFWLLNMIVNVLITFLFIFLSSLRLKKISS